MTKLGIAAVVTVIAVTAAGIVAVAGGKGVAQSNAISVSRLPSEGNMPSLGGATQWLNSYPLTTQQLRGKVVVVQIWTYTCINWLRTLPYARAWEKKYMDQGLVVIGVHSPEFEFEKDVENVQRAAKDLRIDYPIAIDSDHAVWRAFRNNYWPALYIVDTQGVIRHHQFGEGGYEESEKVIQQLLIEAGSNAFDHGVVSVDARGAEVAAEWSSLKSSENYLGYERSEHFASRGGVASNRTHIYSVPEKLWLNQWAVAGEWNIKKQGIVLSKSNGRIAYRFHARDLHLVMGPAEKGNAVRFRVLIDGKPPGVAHGVDVDADGIGRVSEQRLYQLIRQPLPIVDRQFEIEFIDPGVEAFAFTFG